MTIMVFDLTHEEVAILTYALEGYQLDDLEQSANMRFAYKQLESKLNTEYIKRELDYSQFEVREDKCPHCKQSMPQVIGES